MIRSHDRGAGREVPRRRRRVRVRRAESRSALGAPCPIGSRGRSGADLAFVYIRYLVAAAGADQDVVLQTCNSTSGCCRKLRIVNEPPQQRVRIEQQLHGSDERGRAIPNASVCFPSAASRSSGDIGSNKAAFGIFKPRHAPGRRRVMLSTGVSRTSGLPARAMTISSPASARRAARKASLLLRRY